MTTEVTKHEPTPMDVGARDVAPKPAPKFLSVVPTNMAEAMEIAKIIAASNFIPVAFRGRPGDVLVVMMQSAELEIPYFQGLQNIAVINGRPTIWGDLVVALVQRSGKLEYLRRDWDEATKTATVRVKRKGFPECVQTFSMEDAKRAKLDQKDTYRQYPQRMCMWRALSFAVRNEFADVLKGMSIAEEAMDAPPIPADYTPIAAPKPMAALVEDFLAPPTKPKSESGDHHEDQAQPGDGEIVKIIGAVVQSTGKRPNGQPWTLYKITLEGGRNLATFSSTDYEMAARASEMGTAMRITTAPGKKPGQWNLASIELASEPDGEDEGHEDEPEVAE